jgi:Protein of unknown function (DUF3738)
LASDSQFANMGVKAPPPSDAADAAPPLLTAIREQLGLKLSSEKTAVDVIAIDQTIIRRRTNRISISVILDAYPLTWPWFGIRLLLAPGEWIRTID